MGSDLGSSQHCPDCGAPSQGYRYCGRCGAHLGDPVSLAGQEAPSTQGKAGGSTPPARHRRRALLLGLFLMAALVGGAFAVSELSDGTTPEAADGEVRLPDEAEEGDLDAADGAVDDQDPPIECVELSGCLRWQVDLDVRDQDGMRIDAAEDAVVVSGDQHVDVFDLDGRLRWTHEAAEPAEWGGHVLVGDDLVVALGQEALLAFELDSGEQRWRAELPERDLRFLSPLPTVVDDTLVVSLGERSTTGADGPPPTTLYGLDPGTGEELWTRSASQAAAGETSIALLDGDALEVVDPGTGEPRWRVTPSWPGGLEPGTRVPMPSAPDGAGAGEDDEQDQEMEVHPWLMVTSAQVLLAGQVPQGDPPEVIVIDAATGDQVAVREGQPVFVGDRLLLSAPTEGGRTLTALDERAETAWEFELEDDPDDCCIRSQAGPGGVALLGPGDRLQVLDADDGSVRHDLHVDLDMHPLTHLEVPTTTNVVLHSGPAMMGGGGEGESVGIELTTGQELWRVRDAARASRVVDGMYLAVTEGTLYALELPGDAPAEGEARSAPAPTWPAG